MTKHLSMACTFGLAIASQMALFAEDGKKSKFTLPKDGKAAVIVFDYKGGFTPPRLNQKPMMTIQADGTVLLPARFQGQASFEGKITVKEIHEILALMKTEKFFEFDSAAVKKKLAAGGPRPIVADAPTTVIKVVVVGKQKEVSHYALGFGLGGPKIPELEGLVRIRKRLMRVQAVVQLGGHEEIQKWLTKANAELKKKFPDVQSLTVSDLQGGGKRANGTIYVSFNRQIPAPDNDPRKAISTSVSINTMPDGTTKVFANHREP